MKCALPLISYILGGLPDQFCNCIQQEKLRKNEKPEKEKTKTKQKKQKRYKKDWHQCDRCHEYAKYKNSRKEVKQRPALVFTLGGKDIWVPIFSFSRVNICQSL